MKSNVPREVEIWKDYARRLETALFLNDDVCCTCLYADEPRDCSACINCEGDERGYPHWQFDKEMFKPRAK